MDVQVVTTGHKYFKIDNAVGMILCEVGICVPLNAPTAQPPARDEFSVGIVGSDTPAIYLKRPDGSTTTYTGAPELARGAFQTLAWSAKEGKRTIQGPLVPHEVVERYLNAFPQDPLVAAEIKSQHLTKAQAAQREQGEGARGW